MACQRSVLSPFNALPPTQNPQNQAISTNRLRSQEKEPSMLRSPTSLRSNPYLRPKKDRPLLGRRYTSRPTKLYLNYRVALSLPSKILLRPYTKHSTRLHKHGAKASLKKILGRGHTKAMRANVFSPEARGLLFLLRTLRRSGAREHYPRTSLLWITPPSSYRVTQRD